jgi:hypothetical protein
MIGSFELGEFLDTTLIEQDLSKSKINKNNFTIGVTKNNIINLNIIMNNPKFMHEP